MAEPFKYSVNKDDVIIFCRKTEKGKGKYCCNSALLYLRIFAQMDRLTMAREQAALLLVQANEKRRQARETDDKAEKLNQDITSGRQKIDIDQFHIRGAHSNISRSGHAIDLVHTNITSERALILSRRAEADSDLFQEAAGSWRNMTRLCDQLLVHGRRRELYVVEKDRQERG